MMMALGPYRFQLSSAAYQRLQRTAAYRWPEQARIGRAPAAQFVGRDLETIELEGIIYPGFRGGLRQIGLMRAMAGLGTPLPLITGTGLILGRWTIDEVREDNSIFVRDGRPRKIEFSVRLKQYGEDGTWQLFT
jgi:uncharacterized protein